jgi:predicted transposase YbfD/YdcC
LYRALRGVDIEALDKDIGAYGESIARWLAQDPDAHWQGVAVDGKEIRGAAKHGPKVHLVSLVTHRSGVTLAQRRVAEKAYEPDALCEMLEGQDLTGMVITMDALYTHAEIAQKILDRGGHYFMVVKANQPELCDDIAYLFSQTPGPGEARWECTTRDKGHGRLETRYVVSSEELNNYLHWPRVGQVLQRTCTRIRPGQEETQNTCWVITSLTHAQASVEELGQLWQLHWTIENRVHYVRDETLGEDRGQIAKGNAPHALASLRNAILSALRARGWASIAQALRFYAANPDASLQLPLEALA